MYVCVCTPPLLFTYNIYLINCFYVCVCVCTQKKQKRNGVIVCDWRWRNCVPFVAWIKAYISLRRIENAVIWRPVVVKWVSQALNVVVDTCSVPSIGIHTCITVVMTIRRRGRSSCKHRIGRWWRRSSRKLRGRERERERERERDKQREWKKRDE